VFENTEPHHRAIGGEAADRSMMMEMGSKSGGSRHRQRSISPPGLGVLSS
jgi:hypothetical protein